MIRAKTAALAAGAVVLMMVAMPQVARADADCQILEIEASNGKPGVDPSLKPIAKKLQKPPFSAWKTFKLLKKHKKTLIHMKPATFGLQPGTKLSLILMDQMAQPNKKVRLRIKFNLEDKSGKRKADVTIKLDSGDYYMIGGDSLPSGGTHVLAMTCAAK